MSGQRKRLKYQWIHGHMFAYKRGREDSRGDRSMCGLTVKEAVASGEGDRCKACRAASKQLWV